ncbi:phage major tail tube protein, partial [Escherichia coli PA3]
MAVPKHL